MKIPNINEFKTEELQKASDALNELSKNGAGTGVTLLKLMAYSLRLENEINNIKINNIK